MAARAYDDAAIALHSRSASLILPQSASALPRPQSVSPVDIQIADTQATEMFLESPEQREGPKPKMVFVDEEEMFNMPELMNEMATGMLVTPLAMQAGFECDGVESYVDLSLWCVLVRKVEEECRRWRSLAQEGLIELD